MSNNYLESRRKTVADKSYSVGDARMKSCAAVSDDLKSRQNHPENSLSALWLRPFETARATPGEPPKTRSIILNRLNHM